MGHIHRGGGRFITVLPRSRKEDAAFRAWMRDHQPGWAEAHRTPGRIGEPDQVRIVCLPAGSSPWPVSWSETSVSCWPVPSGRASGWPLSL